MRTTLPDITDFILISSQLPADNGNVESIIVPECSKQCLQKSRALSMPAGNIRTGPSVGIEPAAVNLNNSVFIPK